MSLDAETRQQLLDSVSRFVRERLRPLEDQVAENDAVPDDIIQEMKELGLFGLAIPEEFGGLGLSMEDECLTMFEMGRTSPAFRSVFGTNVGIGSQGIVMFGSDEQKQEWLPGLASGEIIASFALTEPEAGSDAGSVRCTAIRDGDEYVINGTKRYITNANKAHIFTLMARTNPDVKGAKGVSSFIVPSDLPGISLGKPEKKWVSRARTSVTLTLTMSACRLAFALGMKAWASSMPCKFSNVGVFTYPLCVSASLNV